jgi:hypothetical protein
VQIGYAFLYALLVGICADTEPAYREAYLYRIVHMVLIHIFC